MIEPLRLSVDIDCPPAHAFATWTSRFSIWWPRTHTASGDPDAEIVLEPWVGGRIYERTPAGEELDWGEITAWEEPRRLSYMWHIRRDRSDATDVELDFVGVSDGSTRLDITHRGWERLGRDGRTWRDANRDGWAGLLPHFLATCQRRAS